MLTEPWKRHLSGRSEGICHTEGQWIDDVMTRTGLSRNDKRSEPENHGAWVKYSVTSMECVVRRKK